MCVAIFKPQGVSISKKILKECMLNNPDGAGYSFNEGSSLKIKKGYFDFSSFWKEYRKDSERCKNPAMIIHFRIATHGSVNVENCHPFYIGQDLVFAHNGIIHNETEDKNLSDTVVFRDKVLSPLSKYNPNWLSDDLIKSLVARYISGSKIVIMDRKGQATILNESDGIWAKGSWFSNDSYKATRYYESYYPVYKRPIQNALYGSYVWACDMCGDHLDVDQYDGGLCSTCIELYQEDSKQD